MDGFLVYYNYFRPNDSLNGKTPADAAKVDYQVKNWKDLSLLPVSKSEEIQSHQKPTTERIKTLTITTRPAEYKPQGVKSMSKVSAPHTGHRKTRSSEIDLGDGIVQNRRTGRRHLRLY